ncbi:MAG: DUF1330 domain-containing protein [Paracoccaceae bacterium]
MSVLLIIQLKITDASRFRLLEETFFAIRPEGLVTLAWDAAAMTVVGQPQFDHVGIAAFESREKAREFFQSPQYRNFTVMREACATAHVQVVHSPAPFDILSQGERFFTTKDRYPNKDVMPD